MSHSRGACAELSSTMETRPTVGSVATVEPDGAVEAAGTRTETRKSAEGIAEAVIGPIIVAGRTFGIVAAARRDTAIIRRQGVTRWADRDRSGRGRQRS